MTCLNDNKQAWQPVDFRPTDQDILCGRNKAYRNHPGNVKFLTMIKSNLKRYAESPTRYLKGNVVAELQDKLSEAGARFIKQDKATNRWYQMDKNSGHEKIGHAIRDNLKRLQKAKKSTGKVSNKSKTESIGTTNNLVADASKARSNEFHSHDDEVMVVAIAPSTQSRFPNYEAKDEAMHDDTVAVNDDSLRFTKSFIQDPAPGISHAQMEEGYIKPIHCASSVYDSLRSLQSDLHLDLFNEDSTSCSTSHFVQEPASEVPAQIEGGHHHRSVRSTSTAHDALGWIQTDMCLDLSNEDSLRNFQF